MKIFIGYDRHESETAYVLQHSIHTKASITPEFVLLNRDTLKGLFTRERGPYDSTDFSISRFLVPYLCHYEGFAIFMDCDMLVRDDIAKLWARRDSNYAVQVVKHKHWPEEEKKFLDQPQTRYSKKNWSSVMIFNNEKCKALTLENVNEKPGLWLHQFDWLDDDQIGDLPCHWNHLVGYDPYDVQAANVHFTTGGPYFPEYRNCDYHSDWFTEETLMRYVKQR